MIFFAGLHSNLTQMPVRLATLLVSRHSSTLIEKYVMDFSRYGVHNVPVLCLGHSATFCHCARSCVICPARDGEDFRVYVQVNAMNLFVRLHGGIPFPCD
jgi:hypothetical protein